MRAYVRFRLSDGRTVELGHGDLIGRLWSAALPIADARISEAHAMVSLRGQELKLLALRGRFAVGGKTRGSWEINPGETVTLAEGVDLFVEEVNLPAAVLALEGDGLPRVALNGVCSVLTRPRPEVVPRFVPDAPAHLWSDGEGWRLSVDGQSRPLERGDVFEVDGRAFRAVSLELENLSRSVTSMEGKLARPVRVVAHFDTAHIHPDGGEPVALNGLSARLVSEVVAFDGPVPWEVLACELWPDEDDRNLLRRKLDVNLYRLRKKLRDAGVRPDLIRSDGFGHVELFLHSGDVVEDRT